MQNILMCLYGFFLETVGRSMLKGIADIVIFCKFQGHPAN